MEKSFLIYTNLFDLRRTARYNKAMIKGNVCKFNFKESQGAITVTQFIHETQNIQAQTVVYPNYGAYLVLTGKGRYVVGKGAYDVKEGSLFFSFAGEPFSVVGKENFTYMYLSFSGSRAEELMRRFSLSTENCVFADYENLIPFWLENFSRSQEETLDLISESVLLYTFSRLVQSARTLPDTFYGILTFIDEHFTESDFSVHTIAQEFHYSPKYVSRLFKKNMQTCFSEHLKNLRIKYALSLMEQGVTSVKNVALLTGYVDALYFSKLFKAKLGISPKEYIVKKQKSEFAVDKERGM